MMSLFITAVLATAFASPLPAQGLDFSGCESAALSTHDDGLPAVRNYAQLPHGGRVAVLNPSNEPYNEVQTEKY
jgi:hypothetical protein